MGWDVDVDVDTTFGEPWAGPSLLQPSLRARRRTPHAARPWGLAATVDCLVVVVLPPVRQHPWRALQGCCPSSSRASEGGGRGEGEGRCRPLRSPNGAGGWCQPCQCQLRLHICMEPLYMILDASQNLGERSSRAVAMPAAHG